MAVNNLNNTPLPGPEGVEILRSDSNGEIFIVNTVLNYYQRKLRVLGIEDAKISAHHLFSPEKVNEARKVLEALWVWRGLEPQPNKLHVYKNIMDCRKLRGGNYRMVTDILDFLQLEDPRMNVTFILASSSCKKSSISVTIL